MDPLDWTHQWENYEMMMYVETDAEPGIWMQVSRKHTESGAESWEVIYDRKIADLLDAIPGVFGSESWQEAMLRQHLNSNPQLVNDEKSYLHTVLAEERHDV
jgi:hypothetical protein